MSENNNVVEQAYEQLKKEYEDAFNARKASARLTESEKATLEMDVKAYRKTVKAEILAPRKANILVAQDKLDEAEKKFKGISKIMSRDFVPLKMRNKKAGESTDTEDDEDEQ